MLNWRRVVCLVLVLQLAAFSGVAGGEKPDEAAKDALEADAACEELAGKQVRVRFRDQSEIEGELVWCYGDSLFVADDSRTHTAPERDIDALWVREEGSGKRANSVLVGILIGGAIGGLAVEMRKHFCEGECGQNTSTVEGALYGALAGGLLGGLFGASSRGEADDWHLWYGSDGRTAYWVGPRGSGIAVRLALRF